MPCCTCSTHLYVHLSSFPFLLFLFPGCFFLFFLYMMFSFHSSFHPPKAHAWDAREFVRKLLVGHEVSFSVEHKVEISGREYGHVWINKGWRATVTIKAGGIACIRAGWRDYTVRGDRGRAFSLCHYCLCMFEYRVCMHSNQAPHSSLHGTNSQLLLLFCTSFLVVLYF